MDIPQLKAFIAIADSGSVSRAAELLHLTQPSVSKRLSLLEALSGRRLFDRVGREMQLNEAGRRLVPFARRAIAEVDEGRRVLAQLEGEVAGQLSIATSHHIGLHRLPPVLKAFTQRYPNVGLDIEFVDSELGCAAVLQGRLELAIVTLPPRPIPGLHLEPIWDDPLAVMVASDHPLARQPGVGYEHLCHCPAILPDDQTYTHRLVTARLTAEGVTPRVLLRTNYLETIKMMVGIGMGWSVLPTAMLDASLALLDFPELAARRVLGAVWHDRRSLSNAAQALLAMMRQAALDLDSVA